MRAEIRCKIKIAALWLAFIIVFVNNTESLVLQNKYHDHYTSRKHFLLVLKDQNLL